MGAVMVEIASDGRTLYVSPSISTVFGYSPEDLIDRQGWIYIHPDDLPALAEVAQQLDRTGQPVKGRFRAQHKSGHHLWIETTSSLRTLPDGAYTTVTFARDVTDDVLTRQRDRDLLRESEERSRVIAEAMREIICEFDSEGRLTYASPALAASLGFAPEELIGTTPFFLVHPDDVERITEVFLQCVHSGATVQSDPCRVRTKDGGYRWLHGEGIAYRRADGEMCCVFVSRDITDRVEAEVARRALETRMQEAQRLEGLGVLAGGIAHDFNNLLTPILGDASLALMDLPEDSPTRVRLEKIQKAARRAAALTHQMLAYAGHGALEVEPLDLSALVDEMAELLASSAGRRARLDLELAPDLPRIEADSSQLSQVVMNLITNAAEAVGDAAGTIAVRTGGFEVGRRTEQGRWLGERLPSGPCVWFEVEDDGCGMDEATQSRIFDPFFTTKFTGRGLGLAAALGIVKSHGGAIDIGSRPGLGTRFRVMFPAAERTAATPPPRAADACDWQSEGTVLVVDDDEGVRELARETLERAGLRVLCAGSAPEAVALFRRHAGSLSLIILERTMPTRLGSEPFDLVRSISPDTPIMLVSGYAPEPGAQRLASENMAMFLQKPFVPETLLDKARALLEGSAATPRG
jgi:PAS domain S-box-containing protein